MHASVGITSRAVAPHFGQVIVDWSIGSMVSPNDI
jgi:hypothetical protein